jgi:uncharacterized protein (DUF1778 family)
MAGQERGEGLRSIVVLVGVLERLAEIVAAEETRGVENLDGLDDIVVVVAEARGESTSDYVLRHAVEAAELDLADRRVFVLDDAAWDELQGLLSATPSQLPPAMTRLLSQQSVLERPAL